MNRNKVCAFGGDALLLAIAAAFLCCVLTGCIIAPVPMTKKINGVAGAPQNQTLDLAFLEVGKTTRSEMRDQLPLVSFTDNDKVFLGRWATSRYGWVWAVGGGGYGGTGAAGAIG